MRKLPSKSRTRVKVLSFRPFWSLAHFHSGTIASKVVHFTHGILSDSATHCLCDCPKSQGDQDLCNLQCSLHEALFMSCNFSPTLEPKIAVYVLRNSSVFSGWMLDWYRITSPLLPWLLGKLESNLRPAFNKIHETYGMDCIFTFILFLFLFFLISVFIYVL